MTTWYRVAQVKPPAYPVFTLPLPTGVADTRVSVAFSEEQLAGFWAPIPEPKDMAIASAEREVPPYWTPVVAAPATPADWATDTGDWAIVELMGHRRYCGRVRETELCGAKMLEIRQPTTVECDAWETHQASPQSFYAVQRTSRQKVLTMLFPITHSEHERLLTDGPVDVEFDDYDDYEGY